MMIKPRIGPLVIAVLALLGVVSAGDVASAQEKKPNILVIWGDDVGVHNISAYNHGIMGYKTPNIDRIAREGALFTDAYAQQSCTAGRASFILGQHPFRTGLLTIGMPGSDHGAPDWAPTIADLLKEQGYTTGQFGKNHLGDRDKHLPTAHGFDEFFGNLYHLNAEEEPETYYYPKDPEFKKKYRTARRDSLLCRRPHPGHRAFDPRSGWRRRMKSSPPRAWISSIAPQGQEAVLRLDEHDAHARLDAVEEGIGGQDRHRALSRWHGGT